MLRSDKFKDCSSDDTFHYRALPGSHSFPRIKLFSRCIFRCITLSFGCRHPPFPLFFPRNSRDIRVTDLTGALPLKRGSIFHSFPPLFHSSIYTELFLSYTSKRVRVSNDVYYSCAWSERKIPLESLFSNHFLWNRETYSADLVYQLNEIAIRLN